MRCVFTQETVAAESAMMIPETRQRLEAALADLQLYVVSSNLVHNTSMLTRRFSQLSAGLWASAVSFSADQTQLASYNSWLRR